MNRRDFLVGSGWLDRHGGCRVQQGVTYFDTYDHDYVTPKRMEARDFFASILK